MYTLYHQDGARSTAALLTLEEGGLDYELRRVDISADEHRDPEFLALNPRGLIPALVTDTGEVLGETAAIMLYLADRHRLTDLAPLPEEPGRGALHDWLFYHVGEVQAAGKRASYPHRYSTNSEDAPRIRDQATRTPGRALADRRAPSRRERALPSRRAFQPRRSVPGDDRGLVPPGCAPALPRGAAGGEALLRARRGETALRADPGATRRGARRDASAGASGVTGSMGVQGAGRL